MVELLFSGVWDWVPLVCLAVCFSLVIELWSRCSEHNLNREADLVGALYRFNMDNEVTMTSESIRLCPNRLHSQIAAEWKKGLTLRNLSYNGDLWRSDRTCKLQY